MKRESEEEGREVQSNMGEQYEREKRTELIDKVQRHEEKDTRRRE